MSFWVTIISMAKLPDKLVNFLHMLGKVSSLIFTLNGSGGKKINSGFFEKNNANLICEEAKKKKIKCPASINKPLGGFVFKTNF